MGVRDWGIPQLSSCLPRGGGSPEHAGFEPAGEYTPLSRRKCPSLRSQDFVSPAIVAVHVQKESAARRQSQAANLDG
jgi:hypothetical protein